MDLIEPPINPMTDAAMRLTIPRVRPRMLLQILPAGFKMLPGFPPAMKFKASRISTIRPSDEMISISPLSQLQMATSWLCPHVPLRFISSE